MTRSTRLFLQFKSSKAVQILNNLLFWGSLFFLLYVSIQWRLSVLPIRHLGYDEGIHLMVGKLWAAGYEPYQEIFVSYPPIFMWSLGLTWFFFESVRAMQLIMAIYAVSGVLAVIYLGTAYSSRLAGLVAGAFLSFVPSYFLPSVEVMTEVPSVGFATTSVALAEKFRRSGHRLWLVLTGMSLGFGLSLKILPIYAIPFVGLMVIAHHKLNPFHKKVWANWSQVGQRLLLDIGLLGGSFLIVFLGPIIFFDMTALYEQVVAMRLSSRETQINPFRANERRIVAFLFSNFSLAAFALYGFLFIIARHWQKHVWLILWFTLTWVSMYLHIPLRDKHLPIFLPILALGAGLAVQHMLDFWQQQGPFSGHHQRWSLKTMVILCSHIGLIGILVSDGSSLVPRNNSLLMQQDRYVDHPAIDFVRQISRPEDCVVADNPVFLHYSGRLPPPQLAETSQTRIDTGFLNVHSLTEVLQTYKCPVVATVTPRFRESIPGLQDWLRERYVGEYEKNDFFVFFGQKNQPHAYPIPIEAVFGHVLQLRGVDFGPQPWTTNTGFISFAWQLKAPLDQNYLHEITFVNAKAPDQVYQILRLPLEGRFHLPHWQPDSQVRDTFQVILPLDLAAGSYNVYLSMCVEGAETCLLVNDQTSLYLGSMTLQWRNSQDYNKKINTLSN